MGAKLGRALGRINRRLFSVEHNASSLYSRPLCKSLTRSSLAVNTENIEITISDEIRAVRRSLTRDSAKVLVQALIASRLDYCNSVL